MNFYRKFAMLLMLLLLTSCYQSDDCGCENNRSPFSFLGFSRHIRGSGSVVRETRLINGVSEVVLSEEGDLTIEVGEQEKLVIEAEQNLHEYLITDVVSGVLDIKKHPDRVNLDATKPIHYYLTVTELSSLTVKNSGDVVVSEIVGPRLRVVGTGSGGVRIHAVDITDLEVELTSSGNLVIDQGRVDTQTIRLSSSGEYDGSAVESQYASVRLSSSGNARLWVQNRIEANLTSSGNLYYSGSPSITVSASSSTGRLIRTR